MGHEITKIPRSPHGQRHRAPRRLCLALRRWRRILRRPRLGRSLVGRRSTGTRRHGDGATGEITNGFFVGQTFLVGGLEPGS